MDEETIRNILETEFNNNHGVDIVAEASETELGLEIIIEYDLQFIFHFIFQGIQNGLDWKILTEAYRIIFNVYNSCAVKFNKFGIDLLVAKALIFTEVITEENRELKRITEAFHVKCFSRFEKCKIFTSDDLLSLSSICSRCLKDSTYYKMCWFLLYRQSMLPDTFFLWPRIVNMFSEDTFKVLEASSPFAYGVINNLGYEILHCKSSTMARTLMDLALSTLNREIYSTDKYIKLHYTTPLEYLENVVSEPNLGKMLIEDFYFQRQMETTFRDFEQNFSLATEEYRIRNSHVLQGMKNIYSKILIKLLQFHDVRSGILLILESVPQGRRIDTQALGGECELLIALYNSYRKENKEEDRNTGFGLLLGLYDKYFARFNSFFNSDDEIYSAYMDDNTPLIRAVDMFLGINPYLFNPVVFKRIFEICRHCRNSDFYSTAIVFEAFAMMCGHKAKEELKRSQMYLQLILEKIPVNEKTLIIFDYFARNETILNLMKNTPGINLSVIKLVFDKYTMHDVTKVAGSLLTKLFPARKNALKEMQNKNGILRDFRNLFEWSYMTSMDVNVTTLKDSCKGGDKILSKRVLDSDGHTKDVLIRFFIPIAENMYPGIFDYMDENLVAGLDEWKLFFKLLTCPSLEDEKNPNYLKCINIFPSDYLQMFMTNMRQLKLMKILKLDTLLEIFFPPSLAPLSSRHLEYTSDFTFILTSPLNDLMTNMGCLGGLFILLGCTKDGYQYEIHVHRSILSSRSLYFETMFRFDNLLSTKKSIDTIIVDPEQQQTIGSFSLILMYMYRGLVLELRAYLNAFPELAIRVACGANYLQLDELQQYCEMIMINSFPFGIKGNRYFRHLQHLPLVDSVMLQKRINWRDNNLGSKIYKDVKSEIDNHVEDNGLDVESFKNSVMETTLDDIMEEEFDFELEKLREIQEKTLPRDDNRYQYNYYIDTYYHLENTETTSEAKKMKMEDEHQTCVLS